ncbi:MAG TPA: lactate utilization protein [Syntrophomonadaceae bacterium]|nr:lactate utilization protein [Syntrophomonadaceae bacterium]
MSRQKILDRLKSYSPSTPSKMKVKMPGINKGSVEVFAQKATAAGAKIFIVKDMEEVKARIKEIITDHPGNIIYSSEDLIKSLQIPNLVSEEQRESIEARVDSVITYEKNIFESNIGITSCLYAIAETGSLVLDHSDYNERLISLAPPIYICIIKSEQILENINMIANIIEPEIKLPSAYSIITGITPAADTDAQIGLGINGPKQMFIIVVKQI